MATISFNTYFDLIDAGVIHNKSFIVDTSDYISQGLSTSDLNGNVKVVSPGGVIIYNNTDFTDAHCDMPSVVTPGTPFIPLPLTPSGSIQPGDYIYTYTVFNKSLSVYYTFTQTVTYSYVRPVADIVQTIDYDAPLFTSTDSTIYTVNSVDPFFKLLTHTVYYPHGSAGQNSPIISSNSLIQTPTFYPGTQTSVINTQLTYKFNGVTNGIVILDEVNGSKEFLVSANSICSLYCCLHALYERMVAAKCANHSSYDQLALLFSQVMGLVVMINTAKSCGHTNDVDCYLNEIQELTGCTSDCAGC